MACTLRTQITERVKAQQQIILVSAAVAGATISFASGVLHRHPEVMSLLCLLYVGLLLALLRQDQEITLLANHLLCEPAFGKEMTSAQARWEAHKYLEMQGNIASVVMSSAQIAGNYGVPFLGVFATGAASILTGPNAQAIVVLVVAALLFVVFLVGAFDVVRRYQRLGVKGQSIVDRDVVSAEL